MLTVKATSGDIAAVAAAVRQLGDDRTIVNEMVKEIRRAVPPVRKAVKANALAVLPKRGGLNRWVARASTRAVVKRGAQTASVTLTAGRKSTKNRADLNRLDRDGRLRHPLYGNRHHWYPQSVAPRWFTDPAAASADTFHDAVTEAVNNAAEKVGL